MYRFLQFMAGHDPSPQIDNVLASYEAALDGADIQDEEDDPPLDTVVAAPPSRSGPRPRIYSGAPITEYTHQQLVKLIRWIKSDDIVRTDDELLEAAMTELGYRRRGQRIVQTLQAAIAAA